MEEQRPAKIQAEIQRLLRIRERQKSRKPEFLRTLWWKFPKFRNDPKWRKPKGNDNKMRLRLKGWPPIVEVGYRSPRLVRGLHPSGLQPVVVASKKEIDKLDPKMHIIYISSRVGQRKRTILVEYAKGKGFRIANP